MTGRDYFRPLVQCGPARPDHALELAGGWGWFSEVEVLRRGASARIIPARDLPAEAAGRLTTTRPQVAMMTMDRPRVMGILNTTPDSFSDGGVHAAEQDAVRAGLQMQAAGVDLLDIGGESTRPGAETVAVDEEIRRTAPVIESLRATGVDFAISIDTRKATVAESAMRAGADLVNDVSGLTYDDALAPFCAARSLPVCVMHAQGDPETMQQDPRYDDVLLDVFDYLAGRIDSLEAQGIPRSRIIADPGIGFGKTLDHNLTLLARLSLFHDLGVPILLGASRKRFIGTIGNAPQADHRAPGSIAVALAGLAHGIQILRVHDVAQTIQAIALWRAAMAGRQA
ncbi:dihydropteroate synthase [Sulfitobacter mediterraneus]|uniref:Dihydropteroate synthase n=1 Tax=Sulfitobacter mediterraneus TaxID=83219 RepID=A0A2T6CIF7_9RHOB|nr:dihydropteroate synthase [Sulfitobacter mediterraneus]KIN76524.1 Dihydropteroate synthase, DHPS [Sulfitobacter mediterraneus KCTC 32188]PTX75291.1 dihydropteroate synthase [Sulfitobacter mediterraneus]